MDYEYANRITNSVIDFAYRIEKQSSRKVKTVKNYQDLEWCFENDVLAIVLHLEGAAAIKHDLSSLYDYYKRGVRSVGLL